MNTRLNVAAMVAALVAFARLGTAEAWLEPPRLALRHALQQQGEPLPTLILRAPTSRSGPDPQQASATPTSDDLPTSTPTSPATAAPSATPAATSRPSSTVVVTGTPTTGAATPTVTWVPPATLPQPIDTPEPTTAVGRPILVVSDSDVRPGAPAPGDDFVVRLEVQNVGRVDAENVLLTLSSDVLVPAGQGASMYKEEIDAGETRPFEARMRVDSSAQTGVYSLAIVLRWDDANGLSYSDQTAIGVHVQGTDESRPLITVNSAQAPSRCVPGAPFSVSFELANIGGWEARNVVLAPAAGTLALEGAGPPPVNIGPGGAATVSLRLVASPVAEPGAVQQVFEIRYDDPDNQRYGDTYQLGITVGNTAAFGPLPIITRYSFGDELHPGQVFQLEIEVLNAGVSDALRTRLALGGTASSTSVADGTSSGSALGVFAPLGSGNVQYLGRLAAGETTTVQQEMVVDSEAKPGAYVLDVGFSYVDYEGSDHTASEVIGLLVSREVSIVINPITVITSTVVGETIPFSVEVINAGDATLNVGNVEVVSGRYMDVVEGATTYVGPLDAGGPFPIDADLLPVAPTEGAAVEVVVHYTDDFNRQQRYVESYEFEIAAAPEVPVDELAVETLDEVPMWRRVLKGFFGLGASAPPAVPQTGLRGFPDGPGAGASSGAAIEIETAP